MPLNLVFITAGNYTLDDDGIPGNNTSVIRDGTGTVIFTFAYPLDSLGFTTSVPSVNLTLNLADALGAANFTIGSLTSAAASLESITIGKVRTTGIVTLAANGTITELGSDSGADVVAGQLVFSAGTGVGTAGNAIETQTSLIEAKTNTGGINISNFGTAQIGGVSDNADGLKVVTSGNLNFTNVGTILLSDDTGTESVHGGISGNVALTAKGVDSDIIATVDNDAIAAPGGDIVLEAGRDIGFGIIGSNFDNDVRAKGSITIEAGRDFLIDGFADLASDDFGAGTGGNVSITAGRNIHVRSVAGTDGSIFANGNAGADVILTTGANGALIVDPASLLGAPQPIASNSGDVIAKVDRILINSASGIGAPSGQVTIAPVTAGREILLGSASDAAFALELSDAELDRIFTPTLTIGSDLAGQITVISAISPANAPKLVLRSGDDIVVNAGITTSGSLELRAGNSFFVTSPLAITAGGSLSIFVDTIGNDGGLGGVADLSKASVSATSITINGAGENDTLKGAESVDQIVHGNGGNDTIVSSGEGHYYGDAGNDLMFAGLSGGIVPEVLDGGAGVDTLDTQSYAGSYIINLATGTTNFSYESFVNFENVTTGGGDDQITGTAGNNVINSGAGNDMLNGGAGVDLMQGGAGNDTYFVDNAGDKVVEAAGAGIDRVFTTVSYALSAGQEVEWLTVTSITPTTAINLTGNEFAQTLQGNNGANTLNGGGGNDTLLGHGGSDRLDGGTGADKMTGGAGDDLYFVDNAGDKVFEVAGEGNDRVYTTVSYALAAGQSVELLSVKDVSGTAAINLTGNELGQTLQGNDGANLLYGGAGNDILYGHGGADSFIFDTPLNAATNVDRIADFTPVDDMIRLDDAVFTQLTAGGWLPAAAFVTGSAAADSSDRIIYNSSNGWVSYDPDGTGPSAQVHFATLDAHLALTHFDFYVM